MRALSQLRKQIQMTINALQSLQLDALVLEMQERRGAQVVAPPRKFVDDSKPRRVRARRPRSAAVPERTVPAWAVPGLPEDADHPLNLEMDRQSRALLALDSSPQSNPHGTHPRKA